MTSSYINSLDGYTIANPDNQSSVTYKMTSKQRIRSTYALWNELGIHLWIG